MRIILTLFMLTLIITGCQKNESSHSPNKLHSLKLNLQEGDPPTLNPYVGVDLRSRCLFLSLFETLMRRAGDGNLVCAAAQSVDIDPSKTIYTFHIRPHHWSNGERVTAYHFADAWKYALDPSSFCFRVDLLYPIKNAKLAKKGEISLDQVGISTPDSDTLIVELERPLSYFLELTATSFFAPLYEASKEEPIAFNGPFTLGNWKHEQELQLVKNPYYWDAEGVDLDELVFTIVQDPQTALAMYEKGDLDLVGDPFSSLPFDVIPDLEQSGTLEKKTISRIFYLLINNESYPLNVKPLRKALSLSLNRQQVTKHLFFGEKPTLSLLPAPLSNLDDATLASIQEDPVLLFEQALEEMNLTRETFPTITLSYAQLSGQKKLAEFLKESWRDQLGIEINIECSEWNVHIANLRKHNFQIGTLHLTTLFQDPMFYFELYKDKEDFCNYCLWENSNFQALLEKVEGELDPEVRKYWLKLAELHLIEHMPAIPVFTQNFQYLKRDNIDLVISDLGHYDFKSTHL